MKIFEISWANDAEKECIAATTNLQAIKTYCNEMCFDVWDFGDFDEIREIPESEWDNFTIRMEENIINDEDKIITFREWMLENPEGGYMCGTMYE